MTTIKDVKEIFAQKGLRFQQLPPDNYLVNSVKVVERHVSPNGDSMVALNITYINDKGKPVSDLFVCEGKIKKSKVDTPPIEPPALTQLKSLPMRETFEFGSYNDAVEYVKIAFTHLLKDNDYIEGEAEGCDLYLKKYSVGFFINITPRFDEVAWAKANALVDLRMKHGNDNFFALAAPAFQDSLGLSLLRQERWISINGEFLAAHRIGVYTVNNKNPNQIFPFTIYPQKDKKLARYFIATTQQWSFMRDKYLQYRAEKEKKDTAISPQ
jgi:hypothetical protein